MRTDNKSGFTLIELLAGMAILSILVLMLGRFFTESSRAWETGTRQADLNNTGRAIMDYVTRELSMAVASEDRFFFDLKKICFFLKVIISSH